MPLRLPYAAALLAAAMLFTPASADMGQIHVSLAGVTVSESAQKAIILSNGKEEVLILGTELAASKKTAVVRFIPFPAEPKVALAPKGVFDRLAGLVAKYKLQYVHTFHSKGGPATIGKSGVEVRFSAKLGSHDITVIRVRDASQLRAWANGYFKKMGLPTAKSYREAETIVADYVARGIDWFVVDSVKLSPDKRIVEPVAYRFASTSLYYPLKDTNTFGGKGEIELFVVAPSTLCAPGSDTFFASGDAWNEGDMAVEESGRRAGPCLGMALSKASTSAMLVPAEHDLAALWPEGNAFFAGKPVFLQAIRYVGAYQFERDVMVPLPAGVAKALVAPEPGDNPFAGLLLPEEHAQCRKVPERGPCKGLFEKFYFDGKSKSCKPFDWGGCQGEVPFETQAECEKTCRAGK
jgi:hypothetical protein